MFASLLSVYGEYTLRLLNTLRSRISYMRLFAIAPHNSLRSDNAPQPGRPRTTAAKGREPPPGFGGTTKMIQTRERGKNKRKPELYSYTQKKEQSTDILTQQIFVDSDCANDGCVALFEHL